LAASTQAGRGWLGKHVRAAGPEPGLLPSSEACLGEEEEGYWIRTGPAGGKEAAELVDTLRQRSKSPAGAELTREQMDFETEQWTAGCQT
jgi:hypothetical protein